MWTAFSLLLSVLVFQFYFPKWKSDLWNILHVIPYQKLPELEKRLIGLNTGDEIAVKSAIEEFSEDVQLDGQSVLNK